MCRLKRMPVQEQSSSSPFCLWWYVWLRPGISLWQQRKRGPGRERRLPAGSRHRFRCVAEQVIKVYHCKINRTEIYCNDRAASILIYHLEILIYIYLWNIENNICMTTSWSRAEEAREVYFPIKRQNSRARRTSWSNLVSVTLSLRLFRRLAGSSEASCSNRLAVLDCKDTDLI